MKPLDCVPKHSREEGVSVGATRQQLVLATAAIAVAMILGGASARAGYVSVAELAEQDGVNALGQSAVTLFVEHDAPLGSAGSGDISSPLHDTDDPRTPVLPSFPFLKVPPAVCNFGHNGAGSSSSSAPSNGSSSLPVGDMQRPQLPQLQLIALLPPQREYVRSLSMSSFLFRPPRAL